MPRTPLHLASGTGVVLRDYTAKAIRFVRYGCTNRPFYHIVVMERRQEQKKPPIEQLGTYDALPNKFDEKLVSFNFERIMYWIGQGAHVSRPVIELLGISGFYPIHPRTYIKAWRNRKAHEEAAAKEAEDEKIKAEAS
ncbi:probable 28S ribosomal protein S16, mitochondrial [Belonocnema kinseyi]|uniref:probable 28S ribosomal protein S16, mitochondrial n=1 Tax=Belonocnema kinseyi TaxID=2817044 RepID=UPI00143DCBA6|nr:probable 28S ribosomal protein S16, mitochondrial [Belonocnema kinseyi]